MVRNGKRNGRQGYLCRACGKSFVETATCAIAHSHSSKTVWKQVIRDTIDGVSIDKTAEALDLAHSTVFHMRHKILYCVERAILDTLGMLEGVCEADETYVLESVKGRKVPEGYHSFIKGRLDAARGVATIYLSRYNALFSQIFGNQVTAADKIYALMINRNGSFFDIATVKSDRLLNL